MAIDTEELVRTLRSIGKSVSFQLGANNPEDQAANLIEALLPVYEAAQDGHGVSDFEAECPLCVAVRAVDQLLEKDS